MAQPNDQPNTDQTPLTQQPIVLSQEDAAVIMGYRCKGGMCKICNKGLVDFVWDKKKENVSQKDIAQLATDECGESISEANVSRHLSNYREKLRPLVTVAEETYVAKLREEAQNFGKARAQALMLRDGVFDSLMAMIRNGLYKPSVSDFVALQALYSKVLTDPDAGGTEQLEKIFSTAQEKYQYLFTLPLPSDGPQRTETVRGCDDKTEAQVPGTL